MNYRDQERSVVLSAPHQMSPAHPPAHSQGAGEGAGSSAAARQLLEAWVIACLFLVFFPPPPHTPKAFALCFAEALFVLP